MCEGTLVAVRLAELAGRGGDDAARGAALPAEVAGPLGLALVAPGVHRRGSDRGSGRLRRIDRSNGPF